MCDLVVWDLQSQCDDAEEWSLAEERVCKNNLLAWYINTRLVTDVDVESGKKDGVVPPCQQFRNHCILVDLGEFGCGKLFFKD